MNDIPLIFQPYKYIGEDTECHKNGRTYHVIETGEHWMKEFGYVVWVTSEENKFTSDIDYCVSFSIKDFEKNFIRE